MDPLLLVIVLVTVAVAFTVSASAGFGGSLVLVPALALGLGTKTGTALAALLLACNNVVKVWAYRNTVPWRKALTVVLLVAIGATLGALLFAAAPERVVTIAVVVTFVLSFVAERADLTGLRRVGAHVLAFGSGATSGFSGTSGPLKGLAVRGLGLDRAHLVGALTLVSLAGDVAKTAVWTGASLIPSTGYLVALAAVPLMVGGTYLGRRLNTSIGETGYTWLFWAVMVGYTARLITGL
ncbi:sulfite exporter TauE/SafE family protein [Saccharothrix luteola]|uniref:sulfite exporter TauE/SafE family protein n=1 Tax=Saccharothrix luteola TaxID=2893018 RepID=UPI001E5F05D3|nr:sulfite exporter TauE/SafE family protein [Saccharothrix luteola]MCC8246423.1 sulfite exporter TauE/SafE family protein [Saccharothrix luteola]